MLIKVAHSPDPDDAFMFYALKMKKFSTPNYEFEDILGDIETLNREAMKESYEVTAISIHAYPYISDKYALLNTGASMGLKYGPIVIADKKLDSLSGKRIAIPGKLTSAYLALKLYENNFEEVIMKFDEIIEAVSSGKVDCGLIIHEGQVTFEDMGLKKIVDLGEWWYEETSLPLPLGGNVIKRSLGEKVMSEVSGYLKTSIEYAMENEEEALKYAFQFGRGLDSEKNKKFVRMYVNSYTMDYGEDGKTAVKLLLKKGYEAGIIDRYSEPEFI